MCSLVTWFNILSRARKVGFPVNSPPSEQIRQTNPLARKVDYSFLTSTNNKTKRNLSITGKNTKTGCDWHATIHSGLKTVTCE